MNDDPETFAQLEVLKSRVEDLHSSIGNQQQRESTAIKWFGLFGVGISVLFVGMQVMTYYVADRSAQDIERRANSVLDSTEERLDQFFGDAMPTSAWVDNRYSDGSKVVTGKAWMYKGDKDSENPTYSIKLSIPARIFIEGSTSTKLIGYEYRFSEELPDILHSDLSRESKQEFKRAKMTYSYQNIGDSGLPISPKAGVNFSIPIVQTRADCIPVETALKKLIDAKSVGTITIRPVLEKASSQIVVRESDFDLRFVSSSLFDCSSFAE